MTTLPPGQRVSAEFPRFGLPPFAERFPDTLDKIALEIRGNVANPGDIGDMLSQLRRVNQTSDFHCVATWSCLNLRWSGYRFRDLYENIILTHSKAAPEAQFVLLRSQDGYRTPLPLSDLLAADVLLADTLNDQPLTVAHGAPIRLVAPAHYGYKSVKYLSRIEFWNDGSKFKPGLLFQMLTHQRGRVAFEERGQGLPGWLLRYLYRPLIRPNAARFQKALLKWESTR